MEKKLKCSCGNDKFYVINDYVRCPFCNKEYKIINLGQGNNSYHQEKETQDVPN